MNHSKRLLALACALLAAPILAQPQGLQESRELADLGVVPRGNELIFDSGSTCSGGIQYDDGSFENGYGWSSVVFAGTFGMRFDLPSSNNRLNAICICWQSLGGSTHDFGLRIWAADGSGGAPGTLLSVLPAATATGIGVAPKFVRYEIPGGLLVPTSAIYVAPVWAPFLFDDRFICADENGPGGQPAYAGTHSAITNPDIRPVVQLGTPTIFPDYRALGLRVEADPLGGNVCIPGPTTLCIDNNPGDRRFKVEVAYQSVLNGGISGQGHAISLSSLGVNQGGLFWFFSASNPEMLIKVVNGCGVNGHFWLYASAGTNLGMTTTVTDTVTGLPFVFTNPDLQAAAPVQTIQAFPCQ